MVVGGACGTYGGGERCMKGFGGRPDVKRKLGRPRRTVDFFMKAVLICEDCSYILVCFVVTGLFLYTRMFRSNRTVSIYSYVP
jgi:hypothetical protein